MLKLIYGVQKNSSEYQKESSIHYVALLV